MEYAEFDWSIELVRPNTDSVLTVELPRELADGCEYAAMKDNDDVKEALFEDIEKFGEQFAGWVVTRLLPPR